MTLAMPDSISVSNLPDGYPAYAGYGDGLYANEAELRARFPGAELVIFTVTGGTAAHGIKIVLGIDAEPGNPDAAAAARWVQQQLAASPGSRPIVYADLASPGYSMTEVVSELKARGITTDRVRLLSAHYGIGRHICRPSTCPVPVQMDGTQWTDQFPGAGGAAIDMSELLDSFFGTVQSPQQWTEFDVAKLPVLTLGASDKAGGGFWSVHRLQALLSTTGKLNGIAAAAGLAEDGVFGPSTAAAVRAVEEHYHQHDPAMIVDPPGKVTAGHQVWSVLLTGSPS